MHHLILYTFTFALCNAVFGYTHHGEIWGMFRWPVVFGGPVMVMMGVVGFYFTEKSRYFVLNLFACLLILPLGFIPAYFFWQWVDWLAQREDRIRVRVLKKWYTAGRFPRTERSS